MELSQLPSRLMRWRAALAGMVNGATWVLVLAAGLLLSARRYGRHTGRRRYQPTARRPALPNQWLVTWRARWSSSISRCAV